MSSLNTPLTDEERKAARALKQAIENSGMSQVMISKALGCSQGTVSQWANSFCRVPAHWAVPLANLLKVSPRTISPSYKRQLRAQQESQNKAEVEHPSPAAAPSRATPAKICSALNRLAMYA